MTGFPARPDGAELLDFDPFGMVFREDPAACAPSLCAASPAFVMMNGIESVVVAAYAQVTAVLRDPRAFSSVKPDGLPGMERIDFFNGLPVMNYSDPPNHQRRRKVVNPAFTPTRTETLTGHAARLIDMLLDGIADRPSFDASGDLAKPLSTQVLLRHFMGIRDDQQHIFLNYVAALPLLDDMRPGMAKPQAFLDAWQEGTVFCREQQDLARQGRCDNLIGVIANSADNGAIDEAEMMAMMIVLLTGGISTVAGAAASAMLNLARFPATADLIRQTPELARNHLEESLRLDPPVMSVMRFAGPGARIAGVAIPERMPVYVMLATACHDPAQFPEPQRFGIERANVRDHLAFGQGIHTCIGNAITRNIVPLLIRTVVERGLRMRVADRADAIVYDTNPRARHLRHAHIDLG